MLGCALWLIELIRDASWPEVLRAQQLEYLGWALLSFIFINGIIIVTLAAVRVRWNGPGGIGGEINAENRPSGDPL